LIVLYVVRNREQWDVPAQDKTGLVRAITAVLGAAIAASAAFWLNHLANSPDFYGPAYVLTAAICAGAVTYLVGTLLGHGGVALGLRWVGWIVMTVPLLVPSTFSLALPVVALLAVTLGRLPSAAIRSRRGAAHR
jgi:hypothetical protein